MDNCLELPLLALIMTYWLLGPEAAREGDMCARMFVSILFSVIVQKEKFPLAPIFSPFKWSH